ncbi:hypothetical protein Tco_1411940, partial [Tanacetum coccineum]
MVSQQMAKRKDAPLSVLTRSGRKTSTGIQASTNPLNTRKSPRFQKQMGPAPSTVKKKPEKSNKHMGSTPLRRSKSGKNPVDVHASNVKLAEKSGDISKEIAEEGSRDSNGEEGSRDSNGGTKKWKRYDAGEFKSRKSPRFQKQMGPTTRFHLTNKSRNEKTMACLMKKLLPKQWTQILAEDIARKERNEIDKFDSEWDEKKKTIVNDFSLEKTLIRNRQDSFNDLLKAKLKDDCRTGVVNDENFFKWAAPRDLDLLDLVESEKEDQESREVAPALLGNPIVPDGVVNLGDSSNDMVSGSHTSEKHMANATVVADATALSEPVGDIPAKHDADMGNGMAGADTTALSEPIGDIPAKHVADMGNDVAGADA